MRDGAGGDWAEDDGLVLVPVVVGVVVAIAAGLRCVAACDRGGGSGVVEVDADV